MPDASLVELFALGAKGFTPDLPKSLPRPWDAPAPREPGEPSPPPSYLVDDELAAAAWVALLLRQPLLLTGDPGVGKTRFAEKLSWDLGLGEPAPVQVKSNTGGRDLLYRFDDLLRFRDATIAGAIARGAKDGVPPQKPLTSYVRLEGLGRAILRAAGAGAEITLDSTFDRKEVFGETAASLPRITLGNVFPKEFDGAEGPRHCVVLIDELDKAPRDTPNDLLGEIERMAFRFDELGFGVAADPKFKPIVVITSNSERNLPDAFLRRCVYHNIEMPKPDRMCRIAAARLGGNLDPAGPLIKAAWELFDKIRAEITEKKPGTAEFIALVAYLRASGAALPLDPARIDAALRVFAKTKADLATAATLSARALPAPDAKAARPDGPS